MNSECRSDSTTALRKREEQISRLLHTTTQGIYGIDTTGACTFINKAALKMLRFEEDDCLGRDMHELIHGSHAAGLSAPLELCPVYRAKISVSSCRLESETLFRKDGTSFIAEYSSYPVFDDNRISGAIVTFSDITRRMQAEAGMRKLSRAVEQSPVSIVITDVNGVIEFVNPKFTGLTGYTAEEAIGMNPRILKSGKTPPETYRELWGALTAGRSWEGEFINKGKDGRLFWEQATVSVIHDTGGVATNYLAVCEDITEKKQIMQQLAQKQKQLESINDSLQQRVDEAIGELRQRDQQMLTQSRQAAMGEMIGNIAHQWRQPLNAISILLGNIRSAHQYGEMTSGYLDKALQKGNTLLQKMSTTITDFSNFFKPDKEIVPFSAREQIDQAVSLISAALASIHISIELEAPEDITLTGFPNEYSQVLLNLLSNARDAIKDAAVPEGKISVRLYKEGDKGCVSVSDNGGGIPAGVIDKIFEPYFSTKEQGTGIGLYMSKTIIERSMKGTLTVHNVDGGAEFVIITPGETSHE